MVTQIEWSDDLLINVDAIDADHKKLFNLMADIFASASHGADAINRAIGALASYTKEHFSREEESMAGAQYPALEAHKYEHEHLVFQLEGLINRLMVSGAEAIDSELAKFLMNWLGGHIMTFDVKYAAYLRETGQHG
ncbi:bacteriohemerythrin [Paramagnetospirillum marisnigri]|nr:bacteriohemerythrin [Paramagnetospirillum marisnigri]